MCRILPFYCLLLLLLASVEGSFLTTLCSRNPSALPGLCRNYLQDCSAVNWEKWKWIGYSPPSASNRSCNGKLLRFERTKDVSQLSATCRSKETQDRCPPTTQQKVAALARALGDDFGSVSPTSNTKSVRRRPSGRHDILGRPLQYNSILSNSLINRVPLIASPRLPRTCRYADPRDLAIVIDSSGSVGKSEFDKTVATLADFISHMCHKFECDGPETRFAVLTYGSRVRTVFNFRHSGTSHHSKADVISDIKLKTKYMTGFTRFTTTGKVLEYCRDKIFQRSRGMRRNSKRTILLLTDGHSNRGTSPGPAATELHKKIGVNIYALGIGDNVDVAELQSITKQKNPNNLIFLALFNDFYEFFKIADTIKDDLLVSKAQCKLATKIFDRKK